MGVDVTKLQFYSGYVADKVVTTGSILITNNGDTTGLGSNTGDQTARIVTSSIANPYGKKAFVRYKWTTNSLDFNSSDTHQVYSYTTTFTDIPVTSSPMQALRAAVSIGVNASNIIFYTANGLHGNVSRLSSSSSTVGYTPVSLDFIIYYAIFEVQ